MLDNYSQDTFCKRSNNYCLRLIVILFICIIMLCGCDINDGKRPYNYSPAKWICEDPYIWFEVDDQKQCYGKVQTKAGEIEIALIFEPGAGVIIIPKEVYNSDPIDMSRRLWRGEAKFSKTEMTLYEATYNELFPDDNMEITFVRQGEPEK